MDPMARAIEQAEAAAARGEVPVGAVITTPDGSILAEAGNETESRDDPTAHAEFLALRAAASARGTRYLEDCTLTVTLEPCALCAAAIAAHRIGRLVFGAYDSKSGAIDHGPRVFSHATTHHKPEIIGGMRESECAALLKTFFEGKR